MIGWSPRAMRETGAPAAEGAAAAPAAARHARHVAVRVALRQLLPALDHLIRRLRCRHGALLPVPRDRMCCVRVKLSEKGDGESSDHSAARSMYDRAMLIAQITDPHISPPGSVNDRYFRTPEHLERG